MLHNKEIFVKFVKLEEAETGNAGEQPVRNILIDGNDKEVGEYLTSNLNFIFVFYSLKNSHYFFIPFIHFPLRQYSKTSEIVREIKEKKKMGVYGTKMQGHIIIIGWDSFAELIAEELVNAKQNIVIIVEDQQDIDLIYNKYDKKNVFVVFSDYRNHQFLKNCNVSESLMTFVNLPTDTDKLVFILNAKKYYPSMNFIISLNEGNLKETFKNAGVTYVLSKNEIASKLIASYIFESHVADFSADLLDSSKSDTDYDIQEFLINEMNPFKNLTFGEFSKRLKTDFNCIAIGLVKNGSSVVKKIPSDSEMIQVGDYVILISDGKSFSQVSKVFHQKQGNIV